MKYRRLVIAVMASAALHGLVLALFRVEKPFQETRVSQPSLEIVFATPSRMTPSRIQVPEPVAVLPSVPAEQPLDETPPETLPEPSPAAAPSPQSQVAERQAESITDPIRDVVTTVSSQAAPTAFQAYVAPQCTVTQRNSPMHNCRTDRRMNIEVESAFADLFDSLAPGDADFKRTLRRDLDRLEDLARRRDMLAAADQTNELEVALVAEQQRQLTDEITRIDNKYAQVNLLRLIPLGIKVFKGLNLGGE